MATGRIPINGTAAIQSTIVDAKGDLIVATGADAVARLAVGTNGHTLVADSVETTGLKWVAAAGPANFSLLNSGGTSLTGAATITVSGISNVDKIMVLVSGASADNDSNIRLRLNGDSGSNYANFGPSITSDTTYTVANFSTSGSLTSSAFPFAKLSDNAASVASGYALLAGCNSAGVKIYNAAGAATAAGGVNQAMNITGGYYNSASTISSVSIISSAGNFDAGTIYIYTSA